MKIAPMRVLRLSAICALLALGLMTWSLVDPTPAPVLLALSLGQLIGTVSFMGYLLVVVLDLQLLRRWRKKPPEPPPDAPIAP